MKVKKIITAAVLLTALLAAGTVIYCAFSHKEPAEPENKSYNFLDKTFKSNASSADKYLYPADTDGLFYSTNPSTYYKLTDGKFTEIKPNAVLKQKINLPCLSITAEIPYIITDSGVFGVSRRSVNKNESKVYEQIFIVLKSMPKSFSSPYNAILLIDTEKNEKSAGKRNYSEAIALNLKGGYGGYVFDQRNRTVDINGQPSADWNIVSLGLINSSDSKTISFSARKYHTDKYYDLYLTENGKTKTIAQKVPALWAETDENGINYLRASEEGFYTASRQNSGKEIKKHVFTADINDYEITKSGYAYRADSAGLNIIHFSSGKTADIKSPFKKIYSFSSSDDRFLIAGKEENRYGDDAKVQKIIISDMNGNGNVFYFNDIMDENDNVFFSGSNIILHKNGKTYVCPENKLF